MDVFKVAESLVNHIKSKYPSDIALVAYYGSYAQGTATKRSDLDFFFIPAKDKGFQVSIQFIVDDISFDFWPISWERAERMATFQEPQTTIIADCKLLYVRSDEDHERFTRLRDTITAMQMPENRLKLIENAESRLRDAYVHLGKMAIVTESQLTSTRIEAHGVVTSVFESLALLNGTYFTKGFGKNTEQIMQLRLRPSNLAECMATIMRSYQHTDVFQACASITADTLELVVEQKQLYAKGTSYADRMQGFYEEEKGILDKIITACEANDYDTAFFFAIHAQKEIAQFLYYAEKGQWPSGLHGAEQNVYKTLGLPDLVTLLGPDKLVPLQKAVEQLSVLLEEHLTGRGVRINRFASYEGFEEFLANRT